MKWRAKWSHGAIALAVVAAAAIAAPAIGGQTATTVVKKKTLKKLIRKEVAKQIGQATGPQGPQGSQGQSATKLFAYIHDLGSANAATVQYGSGVTAVSDPDGTNTYLVRFNQSLLNCVVQATAGVGDPSGTTPLAAGAYIPRVNMSEGDVDQVEVVFITDAGAAIDTSFLIAAFC